MLVFSKVNLARLCPDVVKVVVTFEFQAISEELLVSWGETFRYVDLVIRESRETNVPR